MQEQKGGKMVETSVIVGADETHTFKTPSSQIVTEKLIGKLNEEVVKSLDEQIKAAAQSVADKVEPKAHVVPELVTIGLGVQLNIKTNKWAFNIPPDPGMALLLLRKLNQWVESRVDYALNAAEAPVKKPIIQKVNQALNNTKRFMMGK